MGKKALVLEGGSLRCMFSAGVTDVMMNNGLPFDGVFGVSAGALTGVNFVSGQPGRTAKVNLDYVNDKRYLGIRSLLLHKSIFNFDFLFGEISKELLPFDWDAFENSPCEFTAVATNCVTGRPMYCEKSSCSDIYAAVRASASMPLLAPMVTVEGAPCLDGGVSVSIPYQKALDEGYEKIVVVTTREHGFRKPSVKGAAARAYARHYRKYPELVRALLNVPRRYNRELEQLEALELQGRLLVVRPQKPITISRTEKDREKLQALYDEGEAVGLERLAALKSYLED